MMRVKSTLPDEAAIRDGLDKAAKAVLEGFVPRLVAGVQAKWPRASGASQAAMRGSVVKVNDQWVLRLTNDADYVGYIKVKGSNQLVAEQIPAEVMQSLLPDLSRALESAYARVLNTPSGLREV